MRWLVIRNGWLRALISWKVFKFFWLPASLGIILPTALLWPTSPYLSRVCLLIGNACILGLWLGFVWADAYFNPLRGKKYREDGEEPRDGGAGVPAYLPVAPTSRSGRIAIEPDVENEIP